ncbi:unnamed protein product, partial [Onchocerca flexuosa]|uniref:RING-type domain-containing protein n=1 Tax=Onchocerca flexuosa TaxID=387005 RepID=A0A183HYT8_9BILA
MEENAIFCSICLGPGSWPKARPKVCKHIFCYLCISTWVKKRSECPLCKRPAKILVVTSQDGKEYNISVKEKTAVQYQREIDEEHINLFQEAEDITVIYARCQVCNLSENEHLLLLCDRIVGQNIDGSSIRCNAACASFSINFNITMNFACHYIKRRKCHCYCLPEKLESVPEGEWFCPFCVDIRVKSVFISRYVRRRNRSSSSYQRFTDFRESRIMNEDEPGPSRINQSFLLREYTDVYSDDEFLTESSSSSVENSVGDNGMESDLDFSFNIDSSKGM